MYKWDLHFSYLCNGLVQAEGGIHLFSFCCMYRKKSFREKAGILWERSKGFFRISHGFFLQVVIGIRWQIEKSFKSFLNFDDYETYFTDLVTDSKPPKNAKTP